QRRSAGEARHLSLPREQIAPDGAACRVSVRNAHSRRTFGLRTHLEVCRSHVRSARPDFWMEDSLLAEWHCRGLQSKVGSERKGRPRWHAATSEVCRSPGNRPGNDGRLLFGAVRPFEAKDPNALQ